MVDELWGEREIEENVLLVSYADHHPLKMGHTSLQAIGRVGEGREPVQTGLAENIHQTVLPETECVAPGTA